MATKNVSIRLAAVGGKQVKAELDGIGNAGKRGFGKVSREAEIANAKLAKFARRAKLVAKVMGVAMVSAGVAMVRSGLQTIDAQAKLAASLGTTTASMQVLARAAELAGVSEGEVAQATIMMTKSLSQAAQDTGPAVKALKALHLSANGLAELPIDQKMIKIQDAIAKFIPTAQQAAVAATIFGARAGLIFTRIDSATLRQATKDVKDFGVAVSEKDAAQIQATNDALSRMGLLWSGISNQLAVAAAPALQSVADAFARIGKTTGPLGRAIKALFNHIDEVARVVGAFAALVAGRFVASMGAASLGIRGVGLSLTALKVAISANPLGLLLTGMTTLIAFAPQISKALNSWLNPQTRFQVATANAVAAMGDQITQSQLLDAALQHGGAVSAEAARQKLIEAQARYKNVAAIIAEQRALALGSKDYANVLKEIKDQRMILNATGFPAIDAAPARSRDAFEAAQAELAALLNRQQQLLAAPEKMTAELALTQKNIDAITAALAKAKDGMVSFGGAVIVPIKATKLLAAAIKKVGNDIPSAADIAKSAWDTAAASLKDYAASTKDISKGIGDSLTNAFKGAENAIGQFVKTGKLDFSSLVSSMLADLAKLSASKFIFGPIANALSGALGNLGGIFAPVLHAGGMAGSAAPQRMVPAMAFAGAPRMHTGGFAGIGPGEVPAILQRGERVLSRREVAAGAGGAAPITINIQTRDAESFRQSRTQVSADIARAVAMGRRSM